MLKTLIVEQIMRLMKYALCCIVGNVGSSALNKENSLHSCNNSQILFLELFLPDLLLVRKAL